MAGTVDESSSAPLLGSEEQATSRVEDHGDEAVHHFIGNRLSEAKSPEEDSAAVKPSFTTSDWYRGEEKAISEESHEAVESSKTGEGDDAADAAAAASAAAEAVAEAASVAAKADSEKPVGKRQQTSFAGQSQALAKTSKDMLIQLTRLSRADIWAHMNNKLEHFQTLRIIAEALGVSPAFVATATVSGVLAFLLFGVGGQLVCTAVGALYPAFESYKALENNDFVAMQFWMMYWIVYAMISSFECASYYIIVQLPFYYPFKLAVLVWLSAQATGGSRYLYKLAVAPTFHAYRESIDDALEQSRASVTHGIKRAASSALDAGVTTGNVGISTIKRGISGVGLGVGSMAQIALVAARSRTRTKDRADSDIAVTHAKTAPAIKLLSSDSKETSAKAEENAEFAGGNACCVEKDDEASPRGESFTGSPPSFSGPDVHQGTLETVPAAMAVAAGGE